MEEIKRTEESPKANQIQGVKFAKQPFNPLKQSRENSLGAELDDCRKQRDEYLAGWQRAKADLLNYKKEEAERMAALIKYAEAELVLNILPILDNFELAARQTFPLENLGGQEKGKLNQIVQGFLQIKTQMEDLLKNQGVEEIKGVGERFNPNLHEVVAETQAEGKEPGAIIEVVQYGYLLHGKVLRPAKVRVAN